METNPNVPTRTAVKFKTLVRNVMGPKDPVTEVLDDQEELETYRQQCRNPEAPGFKHAVAFPEEVAVAVALGTRPTLGYDVQVIAVIRETGGIVGVQHHVLYTVTEPHGPAGQELSFPQHVIRVRGLHGIVHFRQVPDSLGPVLRGADVREDARARLSTLATGEEGGDPTTLAIGEEDMSNQLPHLTTLRLGEEGPTWVWGEQPTTMWSPWEESVTTLRLGEEGWPSDPRLEDPFGGQGGGRGPFG